MSVKTYENPEISSTPFAPFSVWINDEYLGNAPTFDEATNAVLRHFKDTPVSNTVKIRNADNSLCYAYYP